MTSENVSGPDPSARHIDVSKRTPYGEEPEDWDYAEAEPDTVGAASRTAKCHHCGERIYEDKSDEWGWVHAATSDARCDWTEKAGDR